MKNLIFVDLDETLIHTLDYSQYASGYPEAIKIVLPEDPYTYFALLRHGAHSLLSGLREAGEVYMLTAANRDYALAMNAEFNLGFPEASIYTRETVSNGDDISHLGPGEVFLIDNLPRRENNTKITFLRKNLKVPQYIQVTTFNGEQDQHYTDKEINHILNKIG